MTNEEILEQFRQPNGKFLYAGMLAAMNRARKEEARAIFEQLETTDIEPCCRPKDQMICTCCIEYYRIKKKFGVRL